MAENTSIHEFIQEFLEDFRIRQWKSEPMDKALRLATTAPEDVAEFATAIMVNLPKGGTFLDAALMFLPEQDWPAIVRTALTHLWANPQNEAAEAVLTHASLQCVQALHPFLPELFAIDIWFQSYSGVYAWRQSGTSQISFLVHKLQSNTVRSITDAARYRAEYGDLRWRAFAALLETRELQALELACSVAPEIGCTSEQLQGHLWAVGCEIENGEVRPLTPASVRHLQFEAEYIERPKFLQKWPIPTWQVPTTEQAVYCFGGYVDNVCGVCGEYLHHLITLAPVPENVGVTGLASLSLATCLSCLGWEEQVLYFQHDVEGMPAPFNTLAEKRVPEFPSPSLQKTRVALTHTPDRWRWQDWGTSNGRENLHRVGGHPCWVQSAEYLICPQCQRTMPFLMQLDSELRLDDGAYFLWGSGGIGYIFWCDTCRVSATFWQCT